MLVPLTGAGAQARQVFDPKHPVWVVLPAQTPPHRCCPAGQPMPDPVLALAETALVLEALLLVLPALVVVAAVVPALAVEVVVPPALLVDGSPPPLVVAPGPSAALPPTPPPKPPSPSLVAPVSAALAQPCATLPTTSAANIKPKPIVFTWASETGLSRISGMIAIVQGPTHEKVRTSGRGLKFPCSREPPRRRLPSRHCRDRVRNPREKEPR